MITHLNRAELMERKQQLFLRSMTGGKLVERDRLLYYTVGEFYNEMSLFIEECEIRKEEAEKLRTGMR